MGGWGLVGPGPRVVSQAVPLPSGPLRPRQLGALCAEQAQAAHTVQAAQRGCKSGWWAGVPLSSPLRAEAAHCFPLPPSPRPFRLPRCGQLHCGPVAGQVPSVAHWPPSRPPAVPPVRPAGASFLPLLRSCDPSGSCRSPHPVWAPAAPQVPPAHVRGLCVQLATLHAVLVHGVCGGACGTARPCGPAPAWGPSPGRPPESTGWRCVPTRVLSAGETPTGPPASRLVFPGDDFAH